jgi:hypothetical protein
MTSVLYSPQVCLQDSDVRRAVEEHPLDEQSVAEKIPMPSEEDGCPSE